MHLTSCNKPLESLGCTESTVNKQFTVYFAASSQYFTRNDYGVTDGKPYICEEKLTPTLTEYTHEDLLMCNDSIINITYDDQYKVRTDFSILYKNKVYTIILSIEFQIMASRFVNPLTTTYGIFGKYATTG
jgi:hypothetical protein